MSEREGEPEGGAAPDHALDPDAPTVGLDDGLADVEPQPQPATRTTRPSATSASSAIARTPLRRNSRRSNRIGCGREERPSMLLASVCASGDDLSVA
jgi:hypothetical protein